MVRLHFVVEGQTEETFVRDVLTEHLAAYRVYADARCLTTGRKQGRAHKGGLMRYDHLRQDLMKWIREDRSPEVWFTTMIDLYGLPADFPGRGESSAIVDPLQRVRSMEKHLEKDIEHHQFIPYIQLHEFEAILFCDLQVLAARYPANEKSISQLEQACNQFPSPEHIDEGAYTAPSKRIREAVPSCAKTVDGPLAAVAIGVKRIESKCRHFQEWLQRLRSLGKFQDQATTPDA